MMIKRGEDVDVTMVICLLALGAAGFAAGLLGIGGGMVLVPFLTMLFSWKGMPEHAAQNKPSRQMPGVAGPRGRGRGFLSGLVGAGGASVRALHGLVQRGPARRVSAALGFPIALASQARGCVSGLNESVSRPGMLGYIHWPALIAGLRQRADRPQRARAHPPAGEPR